MAAISGTNGSIMVGGVEVGLFKEWKLDISIDALDTTNFGSDGWKEAISGLKSGTITANGLYDVSDAGQGDLDNLISSGVSAVVKCYTDEVNYYQASAIVTGANISTPNDGLVTVDYTMQTTGAITTPALLS
jgi:predicted secreted protein